MKEIQVQFAARFIERQWSTAIGKSLLKTLTEPITNSDDSYRRLSESGSLDSPTVFPLSIVVHRRRRLVQIIDEAQGMGYSELEKKFEEYGAAKSGAYEGYSARGLFGQGISDVLFYHTNGKIKSIKDGEASICSFYKRNGKPYINIEPFKGSAAKAAKEWAISGDHGTVVEFTVDEDTPIHDFDNLLRKLRIFYMLRLIHANDTRKIQLIYKDFRSAHDAIIKYDFPKGELIEHKEFTFEIEGYDAVKVEAELYRSETPLSTDDEERENGLLVFDDKQAVYDQTFFGLENLRGADKYFGTMKLTGAREIILAKINDPKHPEAILTDSRDGLDKQHVFYKMLQAKVKDWLYPILNEEGRKRTDEGASENVKERHQKALDELNKLYKELSGEDLSGTIKNKIKGRPIGGIEFARRSISITAGKQYGIQLSVDTRAIPVGSKISVLTKKWKVSCSPRSVAVTHPPQEKDDIFVKTILIKGKYVGDVDTIEASFEEHNASSVVSVVAEEVIYPENGMTFSPDYVVLKPETKNSLNLYIDTSVIKVGDKISFTSSNNTIEILSSAKSVPKPKNGNISLVTVDVACKEDGQIGIVEALSSEYACQCKIDVRTRTSTPPKNNAGKFKDWTFESALPRSRQTTYDDIPGSATQGYILISTTHPINKRYFGENPTKTSVESSKISQLYLAELILNESLGAIVAEVYQKGFIPNNYGPAIDIPVFVSNKKYELGQKIYDCFVEEEPTLFEVKRDKKLETAKSERAVTTTQILDGLEERSRQIVEMYFGLNEQRPHTLQEIALKFDVTRERIRQIINKALAPKRQDTIDEVDLTDYLMEQELILSSTVDKILGLTARSYGLKETEIKKVTRRADIAMARQVAMYILRTNLGLSYPGIGQIFDKDHTTVIHGHNKVRKLIAKDKTLWKRVTAIQHNIEPMGGLSEFIEK